MLQPNAKLTVEEKKLFQFIRLYAQKFGFQPSRKEMAEYFEIKKVTISKRLNSMQAKNWIEIREERAILLFDEVNLKRSFSIK